MFPFKKGVRMTIRSLMWILWPSFLVAGVLSAVVFALVDPLDIVVLGHMQVDRLTFYTVAFFLFWLAVSVACALSLYMSSGSPAALAEPADGLD